LVPERYIIQNTGKFGLTPQRAANQARHHHPENGTELFRKFFRRVKFSTLLGTGGNILITVWRPGIAGGLKRQA
jgi:hypothetical protein